VLKNNTHDHKYSSPRGAPLGTVISPYRRQGGLTEWSTPENRALTQCEFAFDGGISLMLLTPKRHCTPATGST